MYQGTTPMIPLRFKGVDITEAKVFISLYDEQKKQLHTFESGDRFTMTYDGNDSVTNLSLTQEETLNLGAGMCSIQGRWVFPDGVAGATQKVGKQIQSVLMKEMISYD